MVINIRNSIISILIAAVIVLAGCASTSAAPVKPVPSQTAATPTTQPDAEKPSAQTNQSTTEQNAELEKPSSDSTQPAGTTSQASSVNRVDVIYTHVKIRCVTCLCFEEHVNHVIETYYWDKIDSGMLTYKVVNIQLPENQAIAKQYQAVGSQLFVNRIENGVDNIVDIQDIWNWNCTNNPIGFERKVKNVIDTALQGIK